MDTELDPRLLRFQQNNPHSECRKMKEHYVVKKPWGEEALELFLRHEDDEVLNALANVLLPPRFTAVWHMDTHEFEVVWAPISERSEFRSRRFEFRLAGQVYECEFRDTSSRYLAIARVSRKTALSETKWRNIFFFSPDLLRTPGYKPTSFWITGIQQWDERLVVDLARHLNFYLRYFDRNSPVILIHDEVAQYSEQMPVRYPLGGFPPHVMAQRLDPYLLLIWNSASQEYDPLVRFLYGYQILEYASFYYIKADVEKRIERILRAPELPFRLPESIRRIIDVVSEDRMQDEHKFSKLICDVVNPDDLWKEIEPNKEYFASDMKFEGGFTLEPLIERNWGVEDFRRDWEKRPRFPESIRKLRNALVHARESRTSGMLAPTRRNADAIRPWLPPLYYAAMQAMLSVEYVGE